MLALLLATAAALSPAPGKGSALDAERAFAADAQTLGQWTAFRKWAAADATMFVPQPVNAQGWLKDRKDPAKAIDWWPTASYVSCDGSLAVNTGGWKRPDGAVGYFSTVWQRQQDGGWKWIVDGGDNLKTSPVRSIDVHPVAAECVDLAHTVRVEVDSPKGAMANGQSKDGSILWWWAVGPKGERQFSAMISTRSVVKVVIDDKIAAP